MKNENIRTVGLVARDLKISRDRVHQKLRKGHFPSAIQLGDGTWLIDSKDYELEQNRVRNTGRPRTNKGAKK